MLVARPSYRHSEVRLELSQSHVDMQSSQIDLVRKAAENTHTHIQ